MKKERFLVVEGVFFRVYCDEKWEVFYFKYLNCFWNFEFVELVNVNYFFYVFCCKRVSFFSEGEVDGFFNERFDFYVVFFYYFFDVEG